MSQFSRNFSKYIPVGLIALLVIICIAPIFFPSSYYFRIGALIYINAIAVTGLVVLMGYAGQISLGHAGFIGIGAYVNALAPVHFGLSPTLSIFLGCAISGILAWFIGRPILRLKGHYLAVATLGFGILIFMVLNNESAITGGPDGMVVESLGLKSVLKSMGLKLKTSQIWYWFSALILALSIFIAMGLRQTRTGRALRALHDSEVAAKTVGIDVAKYKLHAFVISAVFASLAGSLMAVMERFVSPDIAGFLKSIELVTMTVLGGAGTVLGGVLGTAVLTILPQVLTFFHDYEHIVLGLIMMLVMIFLREGLLPSMSSYLQGRQK